MKIMKTVFCSVLFSLTPLYIIPTPPLRTKIMESLKDFLTVGNAAQMGAKALGLASLLFIGHHEKGYHDALHEVNKAQKGNETPDENHVKNMNDHGKHAYLTQAYTFFSKVNKNLDHLSQDKKKNNVQSLKILTKIV